MDDPTPISPDQFTETDPDRWQAAEQLDVVQVTGEDAARFLQGQLTCDVNLLASESALPFAWCSPAGRVRHAGWLTGQGQTFYLLLATGAAGNCVEALRPYVLRTKVRLTAGSETGLGLSWRWQTTTAGRESDQSRSSACTLPGQPARLVRIAGQAAPAGATHDYVLAGIRAGVCELPLELTERFLPQMLNLDLIGGVSFTKGCFPGQEVIARLHNLGRVKRRLLRFSTQSGHWPPGTDLLANEKTVGSLVACATSDGGSELLAVVSLAAMTDSALELAVPGRPPLTPEPLPYSIPEMQPG